MASSSTKKVVEVLFEDQEPRKWSLPLKEDTFLTFMERENSGVFGNGSLFSPLLFGKFFDPSDAFPLWEFDAHVLLSGSWISGSDQKRIVDWMETDQHYILKAELPDVGKNSIQVCVEGGKVLELCGVWVQQKGSMASIYKDWKARNWWETGFVRRVELPEDADCKKMEANLMHDKVLEITIPKGS